MQSAGALVALVAFLALVALVALLALWSRYALVALLALQTLQTGDALITLVTLVTFELAPGVICGIAALRGCGLVGGDADVLGCALGLLVHAAAVCIVRIGNPGVEGLSVRSLAARHALFTLDLRPGIICRSVALRGRGLVISKADECLSRGIVGDASALCVVGIADPCVERLAVLAVGTGHTLRALVALLAFLSFLSLWSRYALVALFALQAVQSGDALFALLPFVSLLALLSFRTLNADRFAIGCSLCGRGGRALPDILSCRPLRAVRLPSVRGCFGGAVAQRIFHVHADHRLFGGRVDIILHVFSGGEAQTVGDDVQFRSGGREKLLRLAHLIGVNAPVHFYIGRIIAVCRYQYSRLPRAVGTVAQLHNLISGRRIHAARVGIGLGEVDVVITHGHHQPPIIAVAGLLQIERLAAGLIACDELLRDGAFPIGGIEVAPPEGIVFLHPRATHGSGREHDLPAHVPQLLDQQLDEGGRLAEQRTIHLQIAVAVLVRLEAEARAEHSGGETDALEALAEKERKEFGVAFLVDGGAGLVFLVVSDLCALLEQRLPEHGQPLLKGQIALGHIVLQPGQELLPCGAVLAQVVGFIGITRLDLACLSEHSLRCLFQPSEMDVAVRISRDLVQVTQIGMRVPVSGGC